MYSHIPATTDVDVDDEDEDDDEILIFSNALVEPIPQLRLDKCAEAGLCKQLCHGANGWERAMTRWVSPVYWDATPYTEVPQYIWECIPIGWGAPVFGDDFPYIGVPHGDASPYFGVPQYMGMHPHILSPIWLCIPIYSGFRKLIHSDASPHAVIFQ
jgi:hypothetical protein